MRVWYPEYRDEQSTISYRTYVIYSTAMVQ